MKYKGYLGSVSYSPEDRVFHGKLEYIRSLVTFEGFDADSHDKSLNQVITDAI